MYCHLDFCDNHLTTQKTESRGTAMYYVRTHPTLSVQVSVLCLYPACEGGPGGMDGGGSDPPAASGLSAESGSGRRAGECRGVTPASRQTHLCPKGAPKLKVSTVDWRERKRH